MDWTNAFDAYCERTDLSYWSEPVNAVTNLAFLLVAVFMWRRTRGLAGGRVLTGSLFAIGVGSWLFDTHATGWAAALDSLSILVFALVYIFLANRDFLGLSAWASALGAFAYVPFAAVMAPVFQALPFFAISSVYWTLPLLMLVYAVLLRQRLPVVARGMALACGILCVSLTFRSVDEAVCAAFPLGTHFMWHMLNAVLLGWMIEVWRRHKTGSA